MAISEDPFDRYTLAHVATGAALRLLGVPLPAVAAVAVGWELVEPALMRDFPGVFEAWSLGGPSGAEKVPESRDNVAVDAVATFAGGLLVDVLRGR